MRSISTQISLSMVFSSIIAILIVSALSMWFVLQRFNNLAMERAFHHFSEDVADYIETYGSWQRAQQIEGFKRFVMNKRRVPLGRPPSSPGERPPPPFRFILLNPQGVIINAPGSFRQGSKLPQKLQRHAKKIEIDGKVVAIAVPIGHPTLSALDHSYLAAINTALKYALLIAGIFAVIVGILFGKGLSRSLKALTIAIQAMKPGDLKQQVEINTNNEVGVLADAFNKMSHDLSAAYKELEKSHALVTQQAQQLADLSNRDELTGLYNRRYFNEHATQLFSLAKRYQHPMSMILIDIDRFKNINDKFGHLVGDKVLATISTLIVDSLRDVDIVARYGGEEFVIAIPETDTTQAGILCERLRKAVEEYSWEHIQDNLKVTMSIGIANNQASETLEQQLKLADEKLYQAKNDGRNRIAC